MSFNMYHLPHGITPEFSGRHVTITDQQGRTGTLGYVVFSALRVLLGYSPTTRALAEATLEAALTHGTLLPSFLLQLVAAHREPVTGSGRDIRNIYSMGTELEHGGPEATLEEILGNTGFPQFVQDTLTHHALHDHDWGKSPLLVGARVRNVHGWADPAVLTRLLRIIQVAANGDTTLLEVEQKLTYFTPWYPQAGGYATHPAMDGLLGEILGFDSEGRIMLRIPTESTTHPQNSGEEGLWGYPHHLIQPLIEETVTRLLHQAAVGLTTLGVYHPHGGWDNNTYQNLPADHKEQADRHMYCYQQARRLLAAALMVSPEPDSDSHITAALNVTVRDIMGLLCAHWDQNGKNIMSTEDLAAWADLANRLHPHVPDTSMPFIMVWVWEQLVVDTTYTVGDAADVPVEMLCVAWDVPALVERSKHWVAEPVEHLSGPAQRFAARVMVGTV